MFKTIKELFYVECKNAALSLRLDLAERIICKMNIALPVNRAKR